MTSPTEYSILYTLSFTPTYITPLFVLNLIFDVTVRPRRLMSGPGHRLIEKTRSQE